jgi:hypothetical protein
MEERKLTCIGCPMGCQLQVIIKDGIVEKVTGNTCKRGADYGKKEVTDPTRIVTSTVRVQSAGAIICAPSIQYIEQMDEKPEDYSQEDDAGLDLLDFYVLPHYLTAPFKKVTEKIMTEFSDLNLCPINNHQGIVIDGEGSKVICKD